MIKIIETADGSGTLFNEMLKEPCHSLFEAISESMQIFIGAGLCFKALNGKCLHILEVGFGTGLNALLTGNLFLQRYGEVKFESGRIFYGKTSRA